MTGSVLSNTKKTEMIKGRKQRYGLCGHFHSSFGLFRIKGNTQKVTVQEIRRLRFISVQI